jgi:putative methylase
MGEPAQNRIIRKLDLERFLAQIKSNPTPNVKLEQYTLSVSTAAMMLHLAAYTCGNIQGKRVLDLGCGTGRLALGAAFLGAESAVGVDIDKQAVSIAHESSANLGFKTTVDWVAGDIDVISGRFDAVIQNPPFGVQKRSADRRFLEKALELGGSVFSLHNHPSFDRHLAAKLKATGGQPVEVAPSPFLERFVEERGGVVKAVYALLLTIPRIFNFHTKEKQEIVVDLYVIGKRE